MAVRLTVKSGRVHVTLTAKRRVRGLGGAGADAAVQQLLGVHLDDPAHGATDAGRTTVRFAAMQCPSQSQP